MQENYFIIPTSLTITILEFGHGTQRKHQFRVRLLWFERISSDWVSDAERWAKIETIRTEKRPKIGITRMSSIHTYLLCKMLLNMRFILISSSFEYLNLENVKIENILIQKDWVIKYTIMKSKVYDHLPTNVSYDRILVTLQKQYVKKDFINVWPIQKTFDSNISRCSCQLF